MSRVSCSIGVLYDIGVCGCDWSFKVSVSSVSCGVGVFVVGI